MIDTRLAQISALVDDARCLVVDLQEEGPPEEWRLELTRSHRFLNAVIQSMNNLIKPWGDSA